MPKAPKNSRPEQDAVKYSSEIDCDVKPNKKAIGKGRKKIEKFSREEDLIIIEWFKKQRNYKSINQALPHRLNVSIVKHVEKLFKDWEKCVTGWSED